MIIRRDAVAAAVSDSPGWGRVALQRVGDAGGITQFGANVQTLAPGAKASVRHWHPVVDEFLIVLDGEVTVVEDTGTHVLGPGDAACWPAGVAIGHTVCNRSAAPARVLVVGTRGLDDRAVYVDDPDRPDGA